MNTTFRQQVAYSVAAALGMTGLAVFLTDPLFYAIKTAIGVAVAIPVLLIAGWRYRSRIRRRYAEWSWNGFTARRADAQHAAIMRGDELFGTYGRYQPCNSLSPPNGEGVHVPPPSGDDLLTARLHGPGKHVMFAKYSPPVEILGSRPFSTRCKPQV